MKHLLTLTLVAVLGFAVVGCTKTKKINASTTAAQCDGVTCDPASCSRSSCSTKAANCPLAGSFTCPLAAKKAANAKPAATGETKFIDCPLAGTPQCPLAAAKAKAAKTKPAATGKPSCCSSKNKK